MKLRMYYRKNGKHVTKKFDYYDIDNGVKVGIDEILIDKQAGRTIDIEPVEGMSPELFMKGLKYLVNRWTKVESLANKEDPKNLCKIIREGGYVAYIEKLEGKK